MAWIRGHLGLLKSMGPLVLVGLLMLVELVGLLVELVGLVW